jgi:hypothetical protein
MGTTIDSSGRGWSLARRLGVFMAAQLYSYSQTEGLEPIRLIIGGAIWWNWYQIR